MASTQAENDTKKKLIQQQEELAKDQYRLKRQANLANVKNAFINLERKTGSSKDHSTDKTAKKADLGTTGSAFESESDREENEEEDERGESACSYQMQ